MWLFSHDSQRARNGSTYWHCNDCKRYSSARKIPLKKLFSIDIAKAHLPSNSSLRSLVSPLLPLSVNSRITPRTRWIIHPEKWWYKWVLLIEEGTLVSSFLWMLKVIRSSIISSFMGKREIKIITKD